MTQGQREAIREELIKVQSSGLAFGFQNHLISPEYGVEKALVEIERILTEVRDAK